MTDYYLGCSQMIADLTVPEKAWLEHTLRPYDMLSEDEIQERMKQFGLDEYDVEEFPGFDWSYQDPDGGIWIRSDESVNLDHLAEIVQLFLKKFRPDDSWSMEWGCWASRPVLDGYGGGAMFITAEEQCWHNTGDWIRQQEEARAKKKFKEKVNKE
jgi:hypothetical protein